MALAVRQATAPMSLREVKEQLAALREEIGREAGPEWISIETPEGATDETIALWLADNLGPSWRRHVIVRWENPDRDALAIVSRSPVPEAADSFMLKFSAADYAVL